MKADAEPKSITYVHHTERSYPYKMAFAVIGEWNMAVVMCLIIPTVIYLSWDITILRIVLLGCWFLFGAGLALVATLEIVGYVKQVGHASGRYTIHFDSNGYTHESQKTKWFIAHADIKKFTLYPSIIVLLSNKGPIALPRVDMIEDYVRAKYEMRSDQSTERARSLTILASVLIVFVMLLAILAL